VFSLKRKIESLKIMKNVFVKKKRKEPLKILLLNLKTKKIHDVRLKEEHEQQFKYKI
jgi:hypothetical protein